jgi:hypothetical protein
VAQRRTLLIADIGSEPLEPMAQRLAQLGFHAQRVKTGDEARELLRDPRYEVGGVALPPDLAAAGLEGAVAAFRASGRAEPPTLIVAGPRPDADGRARLRRAGVRFALWTPADDHTLRFQANRVLAGGGPRRAARVAERVPTNWPVKIRCGGREKWAKVYSVSTSGAYLVTSRPSMVRALVYLDLPLPGEDVPIAGEVMMTNVPGNLVQRNLPIGMGIRFRATDPDAAQRLVAFTTDRSRQLVI